MLTSALNNHTIVMQTPSATTPLALLPAIVLLVMMEMERSVWISMSASRALTVAIETLHV